MARNRQRAKQRQARRQAVGQPKTGNGARAANGSAGAPPQDEGTVKAEAAIEVKDELKQERQAAKAKSKAADNAAPKQKSAAKSAPAAPKQRGRFVSFLRSSWAELRRVQWPDRRQVTTLTSIVLGFVIIAGAYLGAIDYVANQIVNFLIF